LILHDKSSKILVRVNAMINKLNIKNRIVKIRPGVIACLLFLRTISYPQHLVFFGYFSIYNKEIIYD